MPPESHGARCAGGSAPAPAEELVPLVTRVEQGRCRRSGRRRSSRCSSQAGASLRQHLEPLRWSCSSSQPHTELPPTVPPFSAPSSHAPWPSGGSGTLRGRFQQSPSCRSELAGERSTAEVIGIDARRDVSIVGDGERGTSWTYQFVGQRFVVAERAAGDARAAFRRVYGATLHRSRRGCRGCRWTDRWTHRGCCEPESLIMVPI